MYTADKYFWWNDAQKKLADEVAEFSDGFIASTIEDIERTKRFPWEYMDEMGKRGWFGVLNLSDIIVYLYVRLIIIYCEYHSLSRLVKESMPNINPTGPGLDCSFDMPII